MIETSIKKVLVANAVTRIGNYSGVLQVEYRLAPFEHHNPIGFQKFETTLPGSLEQYSAVFKMPFLPPIKYPPFIWGAAIAIAESDRGIRYGINCCPTHWQITDTEDTPQSSFPCLLVYEAVTYGEDWISLFQPRA